jgi:hypothetical protein
MRDARIPSTKNPPAPSQIGGFFVSSWWSDDKEFSMLKVYTTEELLDILDQEKRACMRGDRLSLGINRVGSATTAGASPFLDQFLECSGAQKFAAYEDFRRTIWEYQYRENISGLVWEEIQVRSRSFRFPRVHEQLASLKSDLRQLADAKPTVLMFWEAVTVGMDLFLGMQGGKTFEPITPLDLKRMSDRSQWTTLSAHGQAAHLEVILQLGWGNPEEACYRRGFPESGHESIHAVFPGRLPLG